MREIKFRAWDKRKSCFFKPTYEAYKGYVEDLTITFSGELIRRTFNDPAIHESVFKDQFILMQYTGLKDKNDKEIYEGDVVNRAFHHLGTIAKRKVVYHEDGFRLEEIGKFKGLSLLSTAVRDIEVIGNIYENPELLEERQ